MSVEIHCEQVKKMIEIGFKMTRVLDNFIQCFVPMADLCCMPICCAIDTMTSSCCKPLIQEFIIFDYGVNV